MLLLARRICRGLGLTARPVIRRGDTTVAVRFDDGSLVGIRPDFIILERSSKLNSSLAKTFTRALAREKRWVISRDDTAWTPPRPSGPANAPAGTLAALRTHMAARLRGQQPVYLTADPCLRKDAASLWNELVEHRADVEEQTSPVLILTARCLRAVLAPGPGRVHRMEALMTHHSGITTAAFMPQDSAPRLLAMERLNGIIQYRLRKMHLAYEADSDSQSDDPSPGIPAHA